MNECIGSFVYLYIGVMTVNCICALPNIQELHLDLQTNVAINRTVKMRCTDVKSNYTSWYIYKGDTLLIDDGSVNAEYSLYEIYTKHTMNTMEIEFKRFSLELLDVYKCVREKGASSNSLDLNDVYNKQSDHAEVKCRNVTAERGAVSDVIFKCTITFSGITCGDNIFWENGNTREKLFTKEGFYKVMCKGSVNNTFITTSLSIDKVTEEFIRTNFFLVYVNRYHTTQRYLVTFNEVLPPNNSNESVLPPNNSNGSVLLLSIGIVVVLVLVAIATIIRRKERFRNCLGKKNCPADQADETKSLRQDI